MATSTCSRSSIAARTSTAAPKSIPTTTRSGSRRPAIPSDATSPNITSSWADLWPALVLSMHERKEMRLSPWPHRLAVALALVTFPLIWVGGLVTTYDAGMAVPDWPGTYGYNLWLYPWQSWLAAPWDLFIEHGHRLLGSAAGLISIALVAVVLLFDRHRWLVLAALGALALVIFQGALGGARVLLDERLVAMLHGCVGPLFFAYVGALV